MNNKCILNDMFDKIYVIHCVENNERLKNIEFQQKESGLNLDIWWTCYHPWSNQIVNGFILTNRCRYLINGAEFNLTREFYTIIKTSYLKGLNHILIFEDDFNLMKNEYLNDFLEHMPNDFDIIQFSILANTNMCDYEELEKLYEDDVYFIKPNFGAYSNCGLALSRKGMKYFIDTIDKEFLAADIPAFEDTNKIKWFGRTNVNSGLNHYITTVPLVYLNNDNKSQVQQLKGDTKSDLYEYYKYINKDFYNIYGL